MPGVPGGRENTADWARRFDPDYVNDEAISHALEALEVADFISTDRPYLYGTEDFRAWLVEFRQAIRQ